MAKTRAQRKAERRAREAARRARGRALSGRRQSRPGANPGPGVGGRRRGRAGRARGRLEELTERRRRPAARRRTEQRRAEARGPRRAPTSAPPRPNRVAASATRDEKDRERRAQGVREAPSRPGRAAGAPARRRHRLPRLLLGRAEEGPVAGPRHPDPGFGGDAPLHRRRRGLPRRSRRGLQLARQANPAERSIPPSETTSNRAQCSAGT